MRHQHRQGHRAQHGARGATQHPLARAAVPIAAHHQQVGAQIKRLRKQQIAHGFGFLALAFTPAHIVVIAFQALQRATNFALSNPAREVLFTVLGREEKYKAKNVIDIVVFRGADAASGWLFSALRGAGLELSAISLATVPVALLWIVLSLGLGRGQERRASPP